jgi:hypothetical protein
VLARIAPSICARRTKSQRSDRVNLRNADEFGHRHALVECVGALCVRPVRDRGNSGAGGKGIAIVDERFGADR